MNRFHAIYARQSIDKADSISIDTQIERCRFEVGDHPYQVYVDRGYSGKNTNRPQFQAMLEDLKSGKIECVVCYKLDRCSRSILDFTQLMNLFQTYNVSFISCTEKFDTGTPMGRAMLNICIVFAQLERETIQERITDAYHNRCKKGYFMGGRVPFGFQLMPYILDGKKTSCYVQLEQEASIMKEIYAVYEKPSASLSHVVDHLRIMGIKNPRRDDGHWVRSHISRMIKNPIYVQSDGRIYDYFLKLGVIPDNPREDHIGYNGCYLYNIGNERHLVLAPHQGIIPPDVWLRCQKTKPKTKSPHQASPSSWLIGKMKCGKCGRAIALRQSIGRNNNVYRYFLCSGSRERSRICEGFKPFPANALEDAIHQAISDHLFHLSKLENTLHIEEKESSDLERMLAKLITPESHGISTHHAYDDHQWQTIRRKIDNWAGITPDQKSKIAKLLISSIELTDRRIVLRWCV